MKLKRMMAAAGVCVLWGLFCVNCLAKMPEGERPTKDSIVFSAEFDGGDDTSLWARFDGGGSFNAKKSDWKLTEGGDEINTTPTNTSFGRWGVYWGEGDDAVKVDQSNEKVYVAFRFKISGTKDVSGLNSSIFKINGKCYNPTNTLENKGIVQMGVKNGTLTYGDESSDTESDYEISLDTWYSVKMNLNYKTKKASAEIDDGNGNTKSLTWSFLWGVPFENITQLAGPANLNTAFTFSLDYMYLWDESFKLSNSNVKNNDKNVRSDASVELEFNMPIRTGTAQQGIKVYRGNDEIETEITENGKKVNVYFPTGLLYSTEYEIKIDETVGSGDGNQAAPESIVFETEEAPYVIGEVKTSLTGGIAKAQAAVRNETGKEKESWLLLLVYDGDGKLIKLLNEKKAITSADKTISAQVDVSALGAVSVKGYVWNGLEIE